MRNLRKIMRSGLCAAVAAVAAVTLSGCKSYTKMIEERPQEYIALSAENTAKSVVSGNFAEEYQLLEKAMKEGTFSLEFEVEGIRFSGECYVNEADEISSQHYTLTGSKGTSAGVYAYSDKKLAKIGTEGKSGNHIYDIDPNTLADKIATSIFAPGSGSYYELDDEEYEAFLQFAGELNSAMTKEEPASDYEDIIRTYFEEHPPVLTEQKSEITINGETIEANIFKYEIPKEDIYSLVDQLVDKLLEDEMNVIVADAYTIDDAKADIMSDFDDYEDYSIKLDYYVNSKTNELMQMDMKIRVAEKQPEEEEDDEYSFYYNFHSEAAYDISISAVYGIEPANAEKQSFSFEIVTDYYTNDYYNDETIAILADVTNSENQTKAVITVAEDGDVEAELNILSVRDGDNYTITFEFPEDEASAKIEGTMVTDKNSFTMTIDRIALMEGSTEVAYSPKAVIGVKVGGEMLVLDAEKEFLDITEEELDALIENIEEDFEAVLMEFAEDSALGSSMTNYVEKSKTATVNANAKQIHTALSAGLTWLGIDNFDFEATDSNASLSFNGVTDGTIKVKWDNISNIPDDDSLDLISYLGEEYYGYAYAEFFPETYAVRFALWSEDPIPDEYKHNLTADEQSKLIDQGIMIGCYPLK